MSKEVGLGLRALEWTRAFEGLRAAEFRRDPALLFVCDKSDSESVAPNESPHMIFPNVCSASLSEPSSILVLGETSEIRRSTHEAARRVVSLDISAPKMFTR